MVEADNQEETHFGAFGGVLVSESAFALDELILESRKSYLVPGFTGFPLKRGGVALDLGLNVGAFSICFANHFDRVVAVEASSRCIDVARANLERAQVTNVQIVHGALDSQSGKQVPLRRIYVGDTYESKDFSTVEMTNESLGETDFPGRFGQVEEVATSIDWSELLALSNCNSIRFVKCDIEGAEYNLLYEADLTMVDCLALELHYTYLGQERVRALISHLKKTHRVLGAGAANSLNKGEWPPPTLIWFVNLQVSKTRSTFLSTLATLRRH